MYKTQSWRVLAFSLLNAVFISVVVSALAVQVALPTLISLVAGTLAGLALMWKLNQPLVQGLERIELALVYLNHGDEVQAIASRDSDLLHFLNSQVNQMIEERATLNVMRGRLYEQISEAAAQEERKRLARDLHDSIKQQVFSMSISAAAAHAHLESNPAAAREALLDVKQSAQEAMVEMRALLQQLSPAPLEKSGLVDALRDQVQALAYRTGTQVETTFGELPSNDLFPIGAQEAVFRIAQEALSNIARHARAQNVRLALQTVGDALSLRIEDNGRGFEVEAQPAGMGLNNIRTRAASIGADVSIISQPGQGTVLYISIPLVHPKEAQMETNHCETHLRPAISLYLRFAVGMSAFIIASSMLIWRLYGHPDGVPTDDSFLVIIMIIVLFTLVVAPPLTLWSWVQARQKTVALVTQAGHKSPAYHKLRRHIHMTYLIISIAAAWFLPIMALGFPVSRWLGVVISLGFWLLALWNYACMYRIYKAEVAAMSLTERMEELRLRLAELRRSWLSVGFMVITVFISSVLDGEIVLPPDNPDHWMNVGFITIAVLLVLNQAASLLVYRGWLKQADQPEVWA